jgi:23S rRNA (cytosine1962-C5)-methyltransferase
MNSESGRLAALIEHIRLPTLLTGKPEAQRLFHGRGHAFPGFSHITIDHLPPTVLITVFRPESPALLQPLASWLHDKIPGCEAVVLQHREQLSGPMEVLRGTPPETAFPVIENGLQYRIQLGRNRNTGLFLDMANGRRWVRENSHGKRILNLFAYTCGFSVAAIAGGARSVVNIDMSSPALSIGRENHRLNKHPLECVRFEKLDIFRSFGRIRKHGPYDLLVCDPPTRQKGSVDIERDYPKILRRLSQFMAAERDLLLCLNAPELGRDFLLDAVARNAPQYRHVTDIKPPDVFVEAQGKGLKTLHFRALPANHWE